MPTSRYPSDKELKAAVREAFDKYKPKIISDTERWVKAAKWLVKHDYNRREPKSEKITEFIDMLLLKEQERLASPYRSYEEQQIIDEIAKVFI